jgi:FKBP-type peptidyl-prolyl cis-trans isomerase 2
MLIYLAHNMHCAQISITNNVFSPGWERSLQNMCVGEKRKLTIPSELAYGEVGSPPHIHPGATLVFEIELVEILEPSGEDDDDLSYYERSHFTEF